MHGESGASRAARHRDLNRIRAGVKRTDTIAREIDAIGKAADVANAQLRDVRAEIDDALSKIQASMGMHGDEESP